jgi:hypothetical protein
MHQPGLRLNQTSMYSMDNRMLMRVDMVRIAVTIRDWGRDLTQAL